MTLIAGVGYGLLAGALVAVFGGVLGCLVGHVARISGTSSRGIARLYGLGGRGSALASLILAFASLGFLALENALLYHATLFLLGWEPGIGNAIAIYGVLTVAWMLLTVLGLELVQRTAIVLLIVFVVSTGAMAWRSLSRSGMALAALLSAGPSISAFGGPADRFSAVLSLLAGSAGALALTTADHARYARSSRDVGILAVGGAIIIDVVVVVLGTIIVHSGVHFMAAYLAVHPAASAAQEGAAVSDKAAWIVNNNAGALYVVVSGLLGFALMFMAQAKAQVLSTHSGSLALSDLARELAGRRLGRVAAVVTANAIGLAMVTGDILGLVRGYLGVLGVTTTSLAGVIIADFFIVRRRRPADPGQTEAVNWAGVTSVSVAAIGGGVLQVTGVTSLGFLVALALVLIGYPLLRGHASPGQLAR
ncbi:hypothetical protein [Kribbella sp. NPDC051620]|uniref:hypothetical protein n=1 Tax=Kribbella sp. NPDC051620 TaxID=3364120 RepID=UPI0037995C3A